MGYSYAIGISVLIVINNINKLYFNIANITVRILKSLRMIHMTRRSLRAPQMKIASMEYKF